MGGRAGGTAGCLAMTSDRPESPQTTKDTPNGLRETGSMEGIVSTSACTTGLTVGLRTREAAGGGEQIQGGLLHGQVWPSRDIESARELLIRFLKISIETHIML